MLLPRLLTAALGVPLILYLIHLGSLPFLALVVTVAALAAYEYGLVLWLGGRGVQRVLVVLAAGLSALAVGLFPEGGAGPERAALSLVVAAALLREMLRPDHSLDRAGLTVLAALFIGWPLGHLALARGSGPSGEALTALLFVLVWMTDSAAYAAGRLAGRRKLAEVLSPKKTWEGAAAGFAAALGTAWAAQRLFLGEALSPAAALAGGALVGTVGQLSDLSQSLVKRAAGVKDSAALLPGHGGVFDRFDSFFLLAPLWYHWCLWASP